MRRRLSGASCIGFVLIQALILLAVPAWAQVDVYVWSGAAGDARWSLPGNWSGGSPPTNDGKAEVRLEGTVPMAPTVDLGAPWLLYRLVYTGTATRAPFTLQGSPLRLTAGFPFSAIDLQDSATGPQEISNPIELIGFSPRVFTGYGKTLVFRGPLTSAASLTFTSIGASLTRLSTGGSVDAPVVELSTTDAPLGDVTLQLEHSRAIADTATLRLTDSVDGGFKSKLVLNFPATEVERISALEINGIRQPPGAYDAVNHSERFGGTGSLRVISAPEVNSTGVTSIGMVSAAIEASATPNGDATLGFFRFSGADPGSCDDSFGTRVPADGGTMLGGGTTPVAYTAALQGLVPGTTYYLCAIASSSAGTSFGAKYSFATAVGPRSPPRIVSVPSLSARCGESYRYAPSELGGPDAGALRWSLGEAPEGMAIDSTTGELDWTPQPETTGSYRVSLVAENVAGVDLQRFDLDVRCARRTNVGCASTGMAPETTLLLLVLGARVVLGRRRRSL